MTTPPTTRLKGARRMLARTAGTALSAIACAAAAPAWANDFPTSARVAYVQECMRNNPGPNYEMVNKCSCALDRLAESVKYEEFTTMATISNAMTIGGERGNDLRDNDTLKPVLKRYRELQSKAAEACFIKPR